MADTTLIERLLSQMTHNGVTESRLFKFVNFVAFFFFRIGEKRVLLLLFGLLCRTQLGDYLVPTRVMANDFGVPLTGTVFVLSATALEVTYLYARIRSVVFRSGNS